MSKRSLILVCALSGAIAGMVTYGFAAPPPTRDGNIVLLAERLSLDGLPRGPERLRGPGRGPLDFRAAGQNLARDHQSDGPSRRLRTTGGYHPLLRDTGRDVISRFAPLLSLSTGTLLRSAIAT